MQACAAAVGLPTRRVHVDTDHTRAEPSTGHAIVEVWLNDPGQWAVFDAMYDCHYEKDGRPLSAVEIRDEHLRDGGAKVDMHRIRPA